MRRLLDVLKTAGRTKEAPTSNDDESANQPDPASSLIIAGEVVPRSDDEAAGRHEPTSADANEDSPRLADVVKSKQKDRWHPPELDGPEFGGLIERRGTDVRGLMPTKYEERPREEHRRPEASANDHKVPKPAASEQGESDEALESTGMFLSALDNSAITLADSGLFKVTDAEEPTPDRKENFDPYDRRG